MSNPAASSGSTHLGYSTYERDVEERLEPGQSLVHGRYSIVRECGRGGIAVVYEAFDQQMQTTVALKVVTSKYAEKPDTAARYHNEARLAAAVGRHPNIVQPIAIGRLPEFHRRIYLTTEFVPGRSLDTMIRSQKLEFESICQIGHGLARALFALHERGIIHRDVKPDNIMVERHEGQEVARLLDFGFAYSTGDASVHASGDLTEAHERPGTAIYMAPEQAVGLRPTPAFDIYAFGATLYEMLTGTHPYGGCPPVMVVERKCAPDDPPRPVARLRDGVPPLLAELTGQCLAREAADRPSIAQVLDRFDALFKDLGLPPAEVSPLQAEPSAESSVVHLRGLTEVVAAADQPEAPRSPPRRAEGVANDLRSSGERDTAAQNVGETRPPAGRWPLGIAAISIFGILIWLAWPSQSQSDPTRSEGNPEQDHDGSSLPPGQDVAAAHVAAPAEDPASPPPATAAAAVAATPAPAKPTPTIPDPEPTPTQKTPVQDSRTPREPPQKKPAPPKPKPKPSTPPWAEAHCKDVRSTATTSRTERQWATLLRAVTDDRKCWQNPTERLQLQVAALFGLNKLEQCIRIASKSASPKVQRIAKQCQNKLDKDSP